MISDRSILLEKKKFLDRIRKEFSSISLPTDQNAEIRLYHYTSLPTIFQILESDSLWATATRFSNDSSEEQVFSGVSYNDKLKKMADNFLICLSQAPDCLSQWRGYCPDGGCSIELDLMSPRKYSVLYANYDTTSLYKHVENAPLRILYVPKKPQLHQAIMQELQKKEDEPHGLLKMHSLFPYFKNDAFHEEGEWRLLFENTTKIFSPCVRFRALKNGAKVPYLVVKCGSASDDLSQCLFDVRKFDNDEILRKYQIDHEYIEIPQGNDQEKIYYQMKEIIYKHQKSGTSPDSYPRIVCAGHLPVRKIVVAPTYNRERLKEEIQRFCNSIYWLQDVEVTCSEIPYIPPSE